MCWFWHKTFADREIFRCLDQQSPNSSPWAGSGDPVSFLWVSEQRYSCTYSPQVLPHSATSEFCHPSRLSTQYFGQVPLPAAILGDCRNSGIFAPQWNGHHGSCRGGFCTLQWFPVRSLLVWTMRTEWLNEFCNVKLRESKWWSEGLAGQTEVAHPEQGMIR